MAKKEFSKGTASAEKPKKPFFSKGGCIVAIFFFLILIFINIYGDPLYTYRQKGYDAAAQSDVRNAFTAAMAYFDDYPNSTISLPILKSILKSSGYVQSSDVNLTVLSGIQSNLRITSFHNKGTKTYTIDSDGNISSQEAVE
jgi:hypothetical protein